MNRNRNHAAILRLLASATDALPSYAIAAQLGHHRNASDWAISKVAALSKRGLIAADPKRNGANARVWRITQAGRDFLAQDGQ